MDGVSARLDYSTLNTVSSKMSLWNSMFQLSVIFFQSWRVEQYIVPHTAALVRKPNVKWFQTIGHNSTHITWVRHIKPENAAWARFGFSNYKTTIQLPHLAHCSVHTCYNVKTPVSKSSQKGSFSPNGSTTTGPPVYPTTGPSALQPNVAKCHLWKLAIKRGAIFPLAKLLNK